VLVIILTFDDETKVKLQQTSRGVMFAVIPRECRKPLKWKKGDIVTAEIDIPNNRVILTMKEKRQTPAPTPIPAPAPLEEKPQE
jgi:hypothetical protein